MVAIRNIFAWLNIVSISATSLLAVSAPALAQDPHLCTEINYVAIPCAIPGWVNVEKSKPFIAERVTKSLDQTFHENDLVARDTAGRIYIENRNLPLESYGFKSLYDANTVWALGTVSILDCFGGKSISLVPGSRTADVVQNCPSVQQFQQSNRAYSSVLARFAAVNPSVGIWEDLGTKKIEGFKAHGSKITWFGTGKNGEWDGKPIRAEEEWMSDDLGATLVTVNSDFRRATEYRVFLTNIRMIEPESYLFEVPPNYKINILTNPVDSLPRLPHLPQRHVK
jgi:hypothetical protein